MPPPDTRPTRRLDTIRVEEELRTELGDLQALAASIGDQGLLHAIVIRPDGTLITGLRRLRACQVLGWTEIPVHVATDLDDALKALRAASDENAQRKGLTPEEAVRLARRLAPLERDVARRRQAAAGPAAGRGHKRTASADSAEPVTRTTREKVARAVGMGYTSLLEATAVVEAAEADPELFDDLRVRMNRAGSVHGSYQQLQKRRLAAKLAAQPLPPPAGPFDVIVADAPWSYGTAEAANPPYPTMTREEIETLFDPAWAAPDCALWLWCTNTHLPVAFDVIRAWGFDYKTCLTWVKDVPGTGVWLRGQTEHCLLAVKGRPTLLSTATPTVLHAARREHSRKPDAFFQLIERICPGRKLELFARQRRRGWQAWGLEPDHFDGEVSA